MKKIQKHIEIVRSSTSRLNSLSQKSCDAIYAVLARNYATVGVTLVNSVADLESLVAKQPDLVFIGSKCVEPGRNTDGRPSSCVWISEYLDQRSIAYTGSGQQAGELDRNKYLAKQRVAAAGVATSPSFVISKEQPLLEAAMSLRFPLFVKPATLGAGQGIDSTSIVHTFAALRAKVAALVAEYDVDALVEEYLPGREFTVAILKAEDSSELAVMPIELTGEDNTPDGRILGKIEKASNQSKVTLVSDAVIRARVAATAKSAFVALGARDYGRVDIRLDRDGAPHFLEANLIPSLLEGYGSFPLACALNKGIGYEAMILRIVNLGLARAVDTDLHEITTSHTPLFNSIATA